MADRKMKTTIFSLIFCLTATLAATSKAHRLPSSPSRNFQSFLQDKIRRVCDDVLKLKQTVKDCCDQQGCTYGGQKRTHGSVFVADDDCNICVCKDGLVECTDSTGCGQSSGGLSYNYKDQVAQAYCSTRGEEISTPSDKYMSAVRRNCDDPSCQQLCGGDSTFSDNMTSIFTSQVVNGFNCVGGLWFWFEHPNLSPNPGPGQPDAGSLNMVTISYDISSCSETGCGPNYCCCMAFDDP